MNPNTEVQNQDPHTRTQLIVWFEFDSIQDCNMLTLRVWLLMACAKVAALQPEEYPQLLVTSVDVKLVNETTQEVEWDSSSTGHKKDAVVLTGVRPIGDGKYRATKVTYRAFQRKVKEEANKIGAEDALLVTHGFNVKPEKFFERVAKGRKLLAKNKVLLIPVLWPCSDKTGIIRSYDLDLANIPEGVAERLVPLLRIFVETEKVMKSTSLMCHSLGNYVLRWMAQHAKKRGLWSLLRGRRKLKHIFMVAPDVRWHIFDQDQNENAAKDLNFGKCIAELCSGNIYVCHSNKDLALLLGRAVHWIPALGRNGYKDKETLHESLRDRVHKINCNSYNNLPPYHGYQFSKKMVEQVYAKRLQML